MSWFTTSAFHFQLPGDRWEERTMHVFRPLDDQRSILMVGRAKVPPEGKPDIEDLLKSLPEGPYDERTILRRDRCQVGPLQGEDVSILARSGATGDYYRFISVDYYELELTFQFAGPMAAREEVDSRVETTLQTLWFRSRT